jgi:hypothetical protein
MRDLETVKKAVVDAVTRTLYAVQILEVKMSEDVGPEGEDVLRIDVIFEGDPSKIDPRAVSGMIRTLRPVLDKADEPAFPLVSLISKADWRGERRAP